MQNASFDFLSEDVKKQREIAEKAFAEAKELDELLKRQPSNEDIEKLKSKMEQAKRVLLEVSRELASNATHTASSATRTFELFRSSTE
jgi:hypothetical protein